MGQVSEIWRHPIKSHGREKLTRVLLSAGQTMPWDRVWAVAHEASKADNTAWAPCVNFTIGAKAPALMAITAQVDEATAIVTLAHPDLPDLVFSPDDDPMALITWSKQLVPTNRAASSNIVRLENRGMTDTEFPSLSIGNLASHRAIETAMGAPLSNHRWRTNIWLDGLEPWVEFDWIGRDIRIGNTEFSVRDRVKRCLATTANPDTGLRDADTLKTLQDTWGHTDHCVYAEVTKSGQIATGDKIEVL